jgi:hypothetical protein
MTNEIMPASSNSLAIMPVVNIHEALARYQAMKEFITGILHEGVDFGIIPGTGTKKTLLKPGAEKFSFFFGLRPQFVDVVTTEDWTGKDHDGEPFFYYRMRCELYRDGQLVASADGSCNSWEKKYRYRSSSRVCPKCNKPTIITGKAEYGGGYICFAKKGGCGAKFQTGDPAIESQATGEVKNPDIAEMVNTILKMAEKRALVAAILIGANASEWFTQDIEDFVDGTFEVMPPAQVSKPAPVEPEPAPAMTPAAESISYEDACKELNANGITYGDLDNAKLSYMLRSLLASLKTVGQSEEEITKKSYKRDAIIRILNERAKPKVDPA